MKKNDSWISGRVKCDLCGYVWIAVFHASCNKLECPTCRFMANYELVSIDEDELRSRFGGLTDEYFKGIT